MLCRERLYQHLAGQGLNQYNAPRGAPPQGEDGPSLRLGCCWLLWMCAPEKAWSWRSAGLLLCCDPCAGCICKALCAPHLRGLRAEGFRMECPMAVAESVGSLSTGPGG